MFKFTKAERARAATLLPLSGTIIIKSEFCRIEVVDLDREIATFILENAEKEWKQEFLDCDPVAITHLVYDFAIAALVKKVDKMESTEKAIQEANDMAMKVSSPEASWNRITALVQFAWF